jgi:O-antigen/teichoic acid export membrane protein
MIAISVRKVSGLFLQESLRARVVRGAGISLASVAGSHVLRLVGNLVLTRLLAPEAFGLVAMAGSITTALNMMSDTGMRSVAVHNEHGGEADFLNTLWTIQIIRGFTLAALCVCLAPLAAAIYGEPRVTAILYVESIALILAGFVSPKVLLLSRNIQLGKIATLSLSEQLLRLASMGALSFILAPVWALVIGGLVGYAYRVAASHLLLKGLSPSLRWHPLAVSAVTKMGRWLIFSTASTFLFTQFDRVLIGITGNAETLGIYSIAFFLFSGIVAGLNALTSSVLTPVIARTIRNDTLVFQRRQIAFHKAICALFIPLFTLGATFGGKIVNAVYDYRYAFAGEMLEILAIGGIGITLSASYGAIPLGDGNAKRHTLLQFAKATVWVVSMIAGVVLNGTMGAVVGGTVGNLLSYPVTACFTHQYGTLTIRNDVLAAVTAGLAILIKNIIT